jgi:hypothetical protein
LLNVKFFMSNKICKKYNFGEIRSSSECSFSYSCYSSWELRHDFSEISLCNRSQSPPRKDRRNRSHAYMISVSLNANFIRNTWNKKSKIRFYSRIFIYGIFKLFCVKRIDYAIHIDRKRTGVRFTSPINVSCNHSYTLKIFPQLRKCIRLKI